MNKKSIESIDVKGKKVLVRCDFNVPLDDNKNITDENRIIGALPTIKYLIENGAKVILCSHMGRPKGEFNMKYSLAPVAKSLSGHLGQEVKMAADVIGESAKALTADMKDGEVVLLENVRFHAEETKNKADFAKELASLADLFVNDAFGTAHRAHASTAGVADYIPAVCGYLIQKEIDIMGKALSAPEHPFVAILGGAKVADKLAVISNLLDKCDTLIIGGGMAYTFAKAKGLEVGKSLVDDEKVDYCREMLAKAEALGKKILLPVDNAALASFPDPIDKEVEVTNVSADAFPADMMGLDIGEATQKLFADEVKNAKTVIWNGPMGVFENPTLAKGTIAVAKALAETDAVTIIGGGDSAAAVKQLGFADKMTHISTGGGASLEYLEGKILPGIDCLLDANEKKVMAAGNWKMNKTPAESAKLIAELAAKVKDAKNDVLVCPPFVCLSAVLDAAKGTNIKVGAQNMYFEEKGAFTGEVAPNMLTEMGVEYVIIGHSERREYFGETDETVNKKVLTALKHNLIPVLCCGETLGQREDGVTIEHIRKQIKIALKGVSADDAEKVIIAYEPIWAIGTGKTATDEQANEVCAAIRALVAELYSKGISKTMRILYGGSVSAKNAAGLFACSDIDGGLVGGASLKPDDFSVIANS